MINFVSESESQSQNTIILGKGLLINYARKPILILYVNVNIKCCAINFHNYN